VVDEYESIHAGALAERKSSYTTLVNHYYDLVTDFYEFGWGQSFHFAPRRKGESLEASLARFEMYLAQILGLKPGMKVLDLGCGVGGPMRAIARFSGANIIGININENQIQRAVKYNQRAQVAGCSFIKADFMSIPVPDKSYDAVYSIESSCHAPDKIKLFSEVFRVMKDGAEFAGSEWCLTPDYEPDNSEHRAIKKGIERGDALPDIWPEQHVVDALIAAGFEVIAARDLAGTSDPQTPWWLPLSGQWSLSGFRRTPAGRWLNRKAVRLLESVRIAPQGSTAVFDFLNEAADALVKGGKSGVFTPMFFFHARKPAAGAALQASPR
jgi:sterol 24-C-methyltransferase